MPLDVEEEDLRHRLSAQVARYNLRPGAIAAVTEQGRRRRRRRRIASGGIMVLVVAAAAMFTVNGNGNGGSGVPQEVYVADGHTRQPSSQKPSPRLITRGAEDDSPGMYALLPGTLVLSEDNCIEVMTDSGRQVAIVWGYNWSTGWKHGKAVLYDPSGTVFAQEGDRVGLGGGGISAATARYADHPCGDDEMWSANDNQAPQQQMHR